MVGSRVKAALIAGGIAFATIFVPSTGDFGYDLLIKLSMLTVATYYFWVKGVFGKE